MSWKDDLFLSKYGNILRLDTGVELYSILMDLGMENWLIPLDTIVILAGNSHGYSNMG